MKRLLRVMSPQGIMILVLVVIGGMAVRQQALFSMSYLKKLTGSNPPTQTQNTAPVQQTQQTRGRSSSMSSAGVGVSTQQTRARSSSAPPRLSSTPASTPKEPSFFDKISQGASGILGSPIGQQATAGAASSLLGGAMSMFGGGSPFDMIKGKAEELFNRMFGEKMQGIMSQMQGQIRPHVQTAVGEFMADFVQQLNGLSQRIEAIEAQLLNGAGEFTEDAGVPVQ